MLSRINAAPDGPRHADFLTRDQRRRTDKPRRPMIVRGSTTSLPSIRLSGSTSLSPPLSCQPRTAISTP